MFEMPNCHEPNQWWVQMGLNRKHGGFEWIDDALGWLLDLLQNKG